MRSRFPSWILLLYLSIDLGNPLVPGAFQFTAEEGAVWVEAARSIREGGEANAVQGEDADPGPSPRHGGTAESIRSAEPVQAWHLTAWLAGVRSGDPPARDFPATDSDDH